MDDVFDVFDGIGDGEDVKVDEEAEEEEEEEEVEEDEEVEDERVSVHLSSFCSCFRGILLFLAPNQCFMCLISIIYKTCAQLQ